MIENLTERDYVIGLIDVISNLSSELRQFLIIENRYYGKTKSYMNSINQAIMKFEDSHIINSTHYSGEILYYLKPEIQEEYKRLVSRKLSSGDCCIILIRKIINIIFEEFENTSKEFREIKTINRIIEKFYANIRNKVKYDSLFKLSNRIKIGGGFDDQFGKYTSILLNLVELSSPKSLISKSTITVMEDWGDNKLTEVSWKNEK